MCCIEGCKTELYAYGMCNKHYQQAHIKTKKHKEGYDKYNRFQYDPDYHPNNGKPYTVKELSYLCTYYARGEIKYLALAVGRTEGSIIQRVSELRKQRKVELYKKLWKEQGWEWDED